MKKNVLSRTLLVSLLLIGFLLPAPVCAQQQELTPRESGVLFEDAEYIALYTPDSLGEARRNITRVLREKGFVIDTIIPSMVSTRLLAIPRLYQSRVAAAATVTARLRPQGSGTLIMLDGGCVEQSKLLPNRKVRMQSTEYRGPRRGVRKAAFRQLEAVARAYPGGKVSYRGWYRE